MSDEPPTTRVTWKPLRTGSRDGTLNAVWAGTGDVELHPGLGPCVVIHLDRMPSQAPPSKPEQRSIASRWKAKLEAPIYTPPPPWEEHIGVVDYRSALQTAAAHGVALEIV